MSVDKNTYELTYIVNSVISDDQVKEMVSRVTQYVSESGGEIVEVQEWGTRRLAYPIQKKRNGFYVNMYFRAQGSLIPRLERALEIDDNILRYLTLRMDAKMVRHYEHRKASDPDAIGLIADDGARGSKERETPEKAEATGEKAAAAPAPADAVVEKEAAPDTGDVETGTDASPEGPGESEEIQAETVEEAALAEEAEPVVDEAAETDDQTAEAADVAEETPDVEEESSEDAGTEDSVESPEASGEEEKDEASVNEEKSDA